MDAIETGIVKLPRIPVAEKIAGDDMPVFRDGNDAALKDRLTERSEGRACSTCSGQATRL
ncbi:MAG: hypothetical protein WA624_18105 [Methylocella sp.]